MPFLFQRLQGRTYNFERDRIHYQSFGLSRSWSSTSKEIKAEKQKLNWNTLLSDYDECIPRTTISQMGKPIIIDSRDYEYRVGSKGSKRTGWRCRNFHKGCKARISTLNETGHIIRVFGEHDHAPPLPKEYKSIIRLLDWNTLLSDFVAYFPRTTKTLQGKPVIIDNAMVTTCLSLTTRCPKQQVGDAVLFIKAVRPDLQL